MEVVVSRGSGSLERDLSRVIPRERVVTSPDELLVYGYDGTWLDSPPIAAVSSISTAEIAAVVRLAGRLGLPIVPRGAGSGLAGGTVAQGGLVLNLTLMDRIVEIDRAARVGVVEPGVVNARFQVAVEAVGLFYPPDPASLRQSTIGGNVATAASGPRCLKYGGTREYVTGLEVVLSDGEVLRIGGRSPQPGAESFLLNLFIGSEGTLGVVSEVTVRLIEKPAARATVAASFPRLDDASRAVTAILGAGIVPLALEVMDRTTLQCVEAHLHAGLPVDMEALLLVDLDGEPAGVAREAALVGRMLREHGAASVELATTTAEADRLWAARRSTSSSFGRLRPNKLGEDISVPRSRIPEVVREVESIARRHDLLIPLFGHIGDGNLHPNILCDLRDEAEMTRVVRAAEEIFAVALRVGGTLSGEHGIGLLKREFLPAAIGPIAIGLARDLKRSLDPKHTLNPGKVV